MTDPRHEAAYDIWFQKQLNALGDWEWNDTKVDAVLLDVSQNDGVQIKVLVDFFTAIDVPNLKEGSVTKLLNLGLDNEAAIINASEWELNQVLGANGTKVYNGLQKALTDIAAYKLLGAFSSERGVGIRKMKKLQQAVGVGVLLGGNLSPAPIAKIDGFDTKTANKVIATLDAFPAFLESIKGKYTISTEDLFEADGILADKKICMTGFRDKHLSAQVEELGGTIQSTVSGKTDILVTTDPNSTSGKAKKARDLGVTIMSVEEFKDMIDE